VFARVGNAGARVNLAGIGVDNPPGSK
jgi:hypothetical protein